MSSSDSVAIVLATYNAATYLQEQLISIEKQSYADCVLYIADDCSTDNTQAIVESFMQTSEMVVKYTQNRVRLGYVKNFEQLLRQCTEPYIACCDQDDIWHHDKITIQMQAMKAMQPLQGSQALLVHSDLQMIDALENALHDSYFSFRGYSLGAKKELGHILGPCGVMGNTILMNSTLKKRVLPFPKQLEHHDYWIAVMAELFGRRSTIEKALVQYRLHATNSSNSIHVLQSQSFFRRCVGKLPNIQTNRLTYLEPLLQQIENAEDKETLKGYVEYLKKPVSMHGIKTLIRYKLIRRGWQSKVQLLCQYVVSLMR